MLSSQSDDRPDWFGRCRARLHSSGLDFGRRTQTPGRAVSIRLPSFLTVWQIMDRRCFGHGARGAAYYILSHQFIAAALNLDGMDSALRSIRGRYTPLRSPEGF